MVRQLSNDAAKWQAELTKCKKMHYFREYLLKYLAK